VFGSDHKIRRFGFLKIQSLGVLAIIATVLLATPVLAAPGDFYTSYQQAKVIAHLPLSGPAPTQMFLQRQGRKQYLYVQQSGKQGFTVIDVSKPKKPKVITNVAQQHIDAMGSALAITQAPAKSDHDSAMAGEGSRGGGARTPQSVRVLDVSDPAHPRTVQTFNGVTSVLPDNAHNLVYVANGDGIWVLSHQQYLRRHLCSSSDAISSAEPNCD
jgi:LVIVD repeat